MLCLDALRGCDLFAVKAFELGQRADDEGAVLLEFCARVACHEELLQSVIHAERLDGQQAVDVDEVDGEVELAQLFVSLQVLDFQDVVEGKVQVVQVAQTAQIFDLTDEVVLKVQDLKLGAQARERAVDALDVLLVQRYFLEVLRAERVSTFLCAPPVVFCAAGARNALSIARACSPRRMRTRVLSPRGICHCARHARAAASHLSLIHI